jgi:CDP-paratose 2-epimerase
MDNLKRRGSELNVSRLRSQGVDFVHGDIRNSEDLSVITKADVIIDACAEPSVMAGLDGSIDYLLNTNLIGTLNCLKLARQLGSKFIFLSTSRVYPIARINEIAFETTPSRFTIAAQQRLPGISPKGISEDFPLQGARSFYGTTKLASELAIEEYVEFFGLKAVVNRCGVLTGPWQMGKVDQGVIVLWLAQHFYKKQLKYFGFGGNGQQVRDLLHVRDLFNLVRLQAEDIDRFVGQVYNVGGGQEVSVSLKELTGLCQQITGNEIPIESVPETRTADIRIYITDNSRITATCGWKPQLSLQQTLEDIHQWIEDNAEALRPILS